MLACCGGGGGGGGGGWLKNHSDIKMVTYLILVRLVSFGSSSVPQHCPLSSQFFPLGAEGKHWCQPGFMCSLW